MLPVTNDRDQAPPPTGLNILAGAVVVLSAVLIVYYYMDWFSERPHQKHEDAAALTDFTQRVIVERWEKDFKDALDDEGLQKMYRRIHIDPKNFGLTRVEEQKLRDKLKKLNIPYVEYHDKDTNAQDDPDYAQQDTRRAWHFAAQFVQEMTNVVRKWNLTQDLDVQTAESKYITDRVTAKNVYAGWLACFRMYMADPVVRNVWERYKFRHVSPNYSDWVERNVTGWLDRNGTTAWQKHRDQWRNEQKEKDDEAKAPAGTDK